MCTVYYTTLCKVMCSLHFWFIETADSYTTLCNQNVKGDGRRRNVAISMAPAAENPC